MNITKTSDTARFFMSKWLIDSIHMESGIHITITNNRERIRRMFRRIQSKLSSRITFLIAAVLIIVFGIETVLITNYLTEISRKNTENQIELRAESISKDVRNIFENANLVTRQMALNKEITTYLKEVDTRADIFEHPLFNNVKDTLYDIRESSDNYFIVWVANEKANFYIDNVGYVSDETYNVKLRPWYPPAVEGEGVVYTAPYIEWESKKNVLSSILALREQREVYGFVVVDISLDSIPIIFDSIVMEEGDQYFLISEDGHYIYHPNQALTLESGIYDESDLLYLNSDFILSESSIVKEIEYNGREVLLTSYEVGVSGWKIVTLINTETIDKRIAGQALWISLTFFVAILAAIVLISRMVSQSTKPFRVLTEYGKEIADGDLRRNIPKVYIDRMDETGDLAESFQTIVEAFRNENDILEERIIEKNEELEAQYKHILENEKVASLGYLVAGIAHEINTPIGNCLSTSTFLEQEKNTLIEKYKNSSLSKKEFNAFIGQMDESIDILTSSLRRAAALVSSFKQVAVDQSSERRYKFDLKECIDSVIVSLRHEYKRTNLTVENLCVKGIELESYPGAITQVLTNFILNSIKHGYEYSEIGHMVIDAKTIDENVLITYSDDGRGMNQETRDKMFDPFFTTNRGSGSSGLGMHIVHNIVTQQLKGEISCVTAPGEGVKFTILLPKMLDN